MRFKIEKYIKYTGEIDALNIEDAMVLIKYEMTHHVAWQQWGKPTMKIESGNGKVITIYNGYDESKGSNKKDILPTKEKRKV